MKKNKQTTFSSKYWLLILAILCIILMGLSLLTDHASGPLRALANYTVVPMQKGINTIGIWMNDVTQNFETLDEFRTKNKELQEKVDELTIANSRLQQEKFELDRLRELYELDQKYADYEKVGARVTASDTGNWFSNFVIDKGEKDGIAVDMNVMAGKGLVGIVTEVGPNWARVRSIIDDVSNVSALMLASSDKCIVSGDLTLMQDGKIRFEQLANNESVIEVGEPIVTSHISSKYLPGILIGYVSDIQVDANNLTRSGTLIPATDFQHLQEVLVITTMK
ncbi:MAG: rod shape-determining protein MreC [Faecalimonas sp.]|nr:rod shape-determining protein MreC [Faecalimonas sp.]